MNKIAVITEAELVKTMELNVASFIVANVDKKHFIPEGCEQDDLDDLIALGLDQDYDFDLYDKERINKKLRKKTKKQLGKITFAGAVMYDLLMSMEIKIDRRAFTFLAFLKDLQTKTKTL
jgi:hypothetical protein